MEKANSQYNSHYSKIAILIGVVLLSFMPSLHAQVFQRFTEADGLPINLVNDIVQDKYGFIWVATEAGLARYDGSRFKSFRHNPSDSTSISSNNPVKLELASNGDLWIVYNQGILDRYQFETGKFEKHVIKTYNNLIQDRVCTMHIDSNTIWIGTQNGLVKYNPSTTEAKHFLLNDLPQFEKIRNNPVFDIQQDAIDKNILWLQSHWGMFSFNKDSNEESYIPIENEKDRSQLTLRSGLAEDEKIWVGSFKFGLRSYDKIEKKWRYYLDSRYDDPAGFNGISAIEKKSDDEMWISSWHRGFGTFNKLDQSYNFFKKAPNLNYSISDEEISIILKDKDNNIWLGSNKGVLFYNPESQLFNIIDLPERTITHDKTHNFPSSFELIDDTHALIGSVSGNGLYIANLKTGISQLVDDYDNADYKTLEKNAIKNSGLDLDVYDLIKVDNNRIWVAMWHQFGYFDINKGKLVFPESTSTDFFMGSMIQNLSFDSDGELWGLNRSNSILFKCNKYTGEILDTINPRKLFESQLLDSRRYGVLDFAFHPDGKIWMVSIRDVIIYDPDSKTYQVLPRKDKSGDGLEGEGFYNIEINKEGKAFISSRFNGLQTITQKDEGKIFSYALLTMDDGLPVDKVIRVACIDNYVWITTRKGLVRYDTESEKMITFGQSDGIPNIDLLNYWQPSLDILSNGLIFFGNPDKAIFFHKDSVYHNTRPPKILLSEIEIHSGENISINNIHHHPSVRLASDQNFFSIKFGMDDFTQIQNHKYKYRLIGFDEDWVQADNRRTANYTGIPGGSYTFEITGANSSETWSDQVTQLRIYIATPFLKSKLYYFLLSAGIIALLILLYRYRIDQIREKDQIRSDLNLKIAEAEMQALRAQMNPHFIFNSLNSINKFILTNDVRTASRYLTKFSKLIRRILNNSSSDMITLQDELETLDIYIELEQLRSNNKFNFDCQLNIKSSPSQLLIPSMILQPFIENAIWHGVMPKEGQGQITLEISEQDRYLSCVIEDNGIGRKKSSEIKAAQEIRKDSKGLNITQERIKMSDIKNKTNSTIDIEDKFDNQGRATGTRVTIVFAVQSHSQTENINL